MIFYIVGNVHFVKKGKVIQLLLKLPIVMLQKCFNTKRISLTQLMKHRKHIFTLYLQIALPIQQKFEIHYCSCLITLSSSWWWLAEIFLLKLFTLNFHLHLISYSDTTSQPINCVYIFYLFLKLFDNFCCQTMFVGREPWSSGYERRLTCRILDGHDIFSYWFVVKIVLFVRKDRK